MATRSDLHNPPPGHMPPTSDVRERLAKLPCCGEGRGEWAPAKEAPQVLACQLCPASELYCRADV